MSSSQRPLRTHLSLNKLDVLLVRPWRAVRHLSRRALERTCKTHVYVRWLGGSEEVGLFSGLGVIRSRAGTSLVAQWLRIHLPMQGTRVRALVQEDPTCRGATKPVRHNYWAWALEPASHSYGACEPQLLSPCATTTDAHAPRARAP